MFMFEIWTDSRELYFWNIYICVYIWHIYIHKRLSKMNKCIIILIFINYAARDWKETTAFKALAWNSWSCFKYWYSIWSLKHHPWQRVSSEFYWVWPKPNINKLKHFVAKLVVCWHSDFIIKYIVILFHVFIQTWLKLYSLFKLDQKHTLNSLN